MRRGAQCDQLNDRVFIQMLNSGGDIRVKTMLLGIKINNQL